jgi:signal transduction histidine kinase
MSFDWWRLDSLAARLEVMHGWQVAMHNRASEPVAIDGITWRTGDLLPVRPAPGARRSLAWQGRLSYQEWLAGPVRSDAFEVIRKPGATWTGFHRALARHGVRYEPFGRGASIVDVSNERFHARAGHLARFATLPKLEERLGPYQPPPKSLVYDVSRSYTQTVALAPPDRGPADLWRQYEEHVAMVKKDQTLSRAARWKAQRASEKFRRDLVKEDTKERLKELRSKDLRTPKKLLRAQLQVQEKQRLQSLDAKIRKERIRLRKTLSQEMRVPSYRYFLRDLAAAGDVAAMEYLASIQARQRIALTLPVLPSAPRIELDPTRLRAAGARLDPSMSDTFTQPKQTTTVRRSSAALSPKQPRLDL